MTSRPVTAFRAAPLLAITLILRLATRTHSWPARSQVRPRGPLSRGAAESPRRHREAGGVGSQGPFRFPRGIRLSIRVSSRRHPHQRGTRQVRRPVQAPRLFRCRAAAKRPAVLNCRGESALTFAGQLKALCISPCNLDSELYLPPQASK